MASQNDLVVVARFKDLVTKEVNRMTRTFVKFSRSAVKAVRNVAKGLGKMTVVMNQGLAIIQKMGAGLKKLGGLISIPIALAAEQERVEAKLEAVLRATGGAAGFAAEELFAMADSLQKVTGFGDEAIINAQAILATFKSIKKEGGVFDAALEVSLDLAELLDGDLQQSVIMIGKAMEEPAVGLTALRRVGVTFSEDQVKLINQLVETNQTFEAQGVILQGLESQVKGISRTMRGTFSGAVRALNNEWGDFLELIGRQLTTNPKLLAGMESVIAKLAEWKENFFEVGELGEKVQSFVDALIESIPDLVRGFGALISFGARFVIILDGIFSAIGKVVNAIGSLLHFIAIQMGPIGQGGMQDELESLAQTLLDISSLSGGTFEVSVDDSAFIRLVKEIGNIAPEFAESMAKALEEGFGNAVAKADEMKVGPDGKVIEKLEGLLLAWENFGQGWSDSVQNRLNELRDTAKEVEALTNEFLDGTQSALVDFFTALRDGTASWGEAVTNLIDTIRMKMSDMLLEFAANRTLEMLLTGVQGIAGIGGGPSEEEVKDATKALALDANTRALLGLTAQMSGSAITGGAPGLLGKDETDKLNATIEAGQEESFNLWSSIGSGLESLGGVFMDVGSFLFNGLMTIVSAIGSLIASGYASAAEGLASFFSDGGPVNYLAGGGPPRFIPRGTDTIPAMLTPGEFVLNRSAVKRIGLPNLERANAQGFADGGLVGGGGGGGEGAGGMTVNLTIKALDGKSVMEVMTGREGKEAITGVFRNAMKTQPSVQRQIRGLGK